MHVDHLVNGIIAIPLSNQSHSRNNGRQRKNCHKTQQNLASDAKVTGQPGKQ